MAESIDDAATRTHVKIGAECAKEHNACVIPKTSVHRPGVKVRAEKLSDGKLTTNQRETKLTVLNLGISSITFQVSQLAN